MKAVLYNPTPLRYILMRQLSKISPKFVYSPLSLARLVDIPEPKLIGAGWVKIKVTMSGICGSDLAGLSASESFYLEPFVSKSFVMGHENAGFISELGKKVKGLKIGDRVTAIPFLSCMQRGIKKLCSRCMDGSYALCENVCEGKLSHGMGIGWSEYTSGGWSEYFIAHLSGVVKLPDEVSNEEAVMIDSFSCALHAVMKNPPKENDVVLVYGCGTMGLNTIASIRALGLKNKIIAIYSRNFQKQIALKFGADLLLNSKEDLFNKITEVTNAKIYFPRVGKPVIEGGVDIIYECVASHDTINNSLRFLKARGNLILIATAGIIKNIDFAPLWFRELSISGSCQQGYENYNGSQESAYEIAIQMIKEKKVSLKSLVTHRFPLIDFRAAIKTAISKEGNAIKVAFYAK